MGGHSEANPHAAAATCCSAKRRGAVLRPASHGRLPLHLWLLLLLLVLLHLLLALLLVSLLPPAAPASTAAGACNILWKGGIGSQIDLLQGQPRSTKAGQGLRQGKHAACIACSCLSSDAQSLHHPALAACAAACAADHSSSNPPYGSCAATGF